MKFPLRYTAPLLAACALTFSACSRAERHDLADRTSDAIHDAGDAMSKKWNEVKNYSFDRKSDFDREVNAMNKEFEANVSQLRADYSEAQASASRRAAMDELKNDEANFKQKMSALGNASADTWTEAKNNVVLAWDKLQASYARARAEK